MMKRCLCGVLLICFFLSLVVTSTHAGQGQWAAFVYLYPNPDSAMSDSDRGLIVDKIDRASAAFSNDFAPVNNQTETVQFIRVNKYVLNGNAVLDSPAGLIRVESVDRNVLMRYVLSFREIIGDFYRLETRWAVTRELNYTDTATLQRLKNNAPVRGTGAEQPNVVVFPLSKTQEWWALTPDNRASYFFGNPELFGNNHLGHNGVGFKFIRRIYRKLYHSRFIDSQQDFMTYFEFSDPDVANFDTLLSELRDQSLNREWHYVNEKPIAYGKRVSSAREMFGF